MENKLKTAMAHIDNAIQELKPFAGKNEDIKDITDDLSYKIADIEYVLNKL